MSNVWPVGVAIYISGTVGEALGANLQRKSLTTEAHLVEHDPSHKERKKFQQKLWVMGFFLFVFAGIFMSVALFFASQTILAPLQLFLFVSNAIFANLINNEIFRWLGWDGLALLCVITGVTMSLVSGPKHSESYSNEELLWLMRQPGFIAFCCFAGLFIVIVWTVKRRILASCNHQPSHLSRRWLRTVLNMSYGAVAGAFGGINVTLTKSVFSLIMGEYKEGGLGAMFSSPVLYILSFVLIGTWVMQIAVTVSGLEETSAIIVISSHSVTEEVVATSGGILYFQDYLKFETWSWPVFIIGNLIAICSVIGLSHLRLQDAEAKEREEILLSERKEPFEDHSGSLHLQLKRRSQTTCDENPFIHVSSDEDDDPEMGEMDSPDSSRKRINTW